MKSNLFRVFLFCLFFICEKGVALQYFTFTANTGNSAVVGVLTSSNPTLDGVALSNGDEIGVFTPNGLCCGAIVWQSQNDAITVWGDNDQTPQTDGFVFGQTMYFKVWKQSTGILSSTASVTYSQGSANYSSNGISILSSFVATSGTSPVSQTAINLKIFLEGAYISTSGTMQTGLQSLGYLPTSQPFNTSPWNYSTSQTVSSFPANCVDWVLLEFRSSPTSTATFRTAALLRNDGQVMSTTGSAQLQISPTLLPVGQYYIVVSHRNHLSIMSATPTSIASVSSVLCNLTTNQGQAYTSFGNPLKQLASGVFGMFASDADASGFVNAADRVFIRNASGTFGYLQTDASLDGVVNAIDRVLSINNAFKTTQVP